MQKTTGPSSVVTEFIIAVVGLNCSENLNQLTYRWHLLKSTCRAETEERLDPKTSRRISFSTTVVQRPQIPTLFPSIPRYCISEFSDSLKLEEIAQTFARRLIDSNLCWEALALFIAYWQLPLEIARSNQFIVRLTAAMHWTLKAAPPICTSGIFLTAFLALFQKTFCRTSKLRWLKVAIFFSTFRAKNFQTVRNGKEHTK